MPRLILAIIIIAFCILFVGRPRADEYPVDANIITALDVSSSINAQETMLQIEGMARAIRSPAVVAAIGAGKLRRIGFMIFAWADGDFPVLAAWQVIATADDADRAAADIMTRLQNLIDTSSRSVGTLTNLSAALEHAADLLSDGPYSSRRSVVNVIGNGEDNVGEDTERARADLLAMGATINAVAVGGDPAILNYYRSQVIGGRLAFVLPVSRVEEMTAVLAAKFSSEISSLNIERNDDAHEDP